MPSGVGRHDLEHRRVALGAGQLALDGDLDGGGEEQHLDLDDERGPADELAGLEVVGQRQLERDRRADQAEDVDLAADAEVGGEQPLVGLQPQVDADRDRHRARRHAEVDRQAGARLEPQLQQDQALRATPAARASRRRRCT